MTAQETRLMPAGNTQKFNPTTGMDREGVNNVATFESRPAAEKRASSESAEIERVLLLEYLRMRRKAEQHKASIESGVYNLRSSR